MANEKEQLEALSDIRKMMDRSSRFLSLSGLSGVFAGVFALAGAAAAYIRLEATLTLADYTNGSLPGIASHPDELYRFVLTDALIVLLASLSLGFLFTYRKARKQGLKIWDGASRRMAFSLFIPLAAGGIFCLELLHNQIIFLIAPATLIFYGLALLNASKYTFNDIRYLGLTEIVLGLIAAGWHGKGLIFWALGFGVMHILYGAIMWYKYERG